MMKHLSLLFVLLLLCSQAEARRSSIRVRNFTSLDLGAYGTNLYERYSVNAENRGLISTIKGFARLRKGVKLSRSLLFEPSFGMMVPWKSSADGTALSFITHLDFNLAWHLFKRLKLRFGTGVNWNFILGISKTVTLNNGGGTSDFYTPGGMSNSFLLTANAGLSIWLSKSLSLNIDAYFLQVASRLQRRVNGAISLGINL